MVKAHKKLNFRNKNGNVRKNKIKNLAKLKCMHLQYCNFSCIYIYIYIYIYIVIMHQHNI